MFEMDIIIYIYIYIYIFFFPIIIATLDQLEIYKHYKTNKNRF